MDNGTVVASSFTMNKLLTNIAKANAKEPDGTNSRKGNNVKLYVTDVEAIGMEQQNFFKEIDEMIAETVKEDEEENEDEIYIDDEEQNEEGEEVQEIDCD